MLAAGLTARQEFSIEIPDKEADAIHSGMLTAKDMVVARADEITVKQAVDYILAQPDGKTSTLTEFLQTQTNESGSALSKFVETGCKISRIWPGTWVAGGCSGVVIYIPLRVKQSPAMASPVLLDRKWMLPPLLNLSAPLTCADAT